MHARRRVESRKPTEDMQAKKAKKASGGNVSNRDQSPSSRQNSKRGHSTPATKKRSKVKELSSVAEDKAKDRRMLVEAVVSDRANLKAAKAEAKKNAPAT